MDLPADRRIRDVRPCRRTIPQRNSPAFPLRRGGCVDGAATTQAEPARWQPGDRLRLRGEQWTVVDATPHPDCEALRLDADSDGRRETFLLPFDRPRSLPRNRILVVSMRAWFHRFKRLLVEAYPYGGLRFFPDTIEVIPYQLEPALAMLRDGHPRVLVADDVGLGKTIEAGLILRELALREDGFRALLLVPAGLRQQWADELRRRFSLEPILADAAWLRNAERELPVDLNPWSLPGVYLASFDFVKRAEALRPLEDVRWDLLIADEAHAATLSTDRRAALDAIGTRSSRVLLLTATPPGDAAEFAGLCRIGTFAGEPDPPVFQRSRTAQGFARRRSSILPVHLTDLEHRMHRTVVRYTSRLRAEAAANAGPNARLVSTILRKRALSSATALQLSLRRRKDLLSGSQPDQLQLLLPLCDDTTDDDIVADASLSPWILGDRASEEQLLDEVIDDAARASAVDSKIRVLTKLLTRIHERAIVFTEYRDTLDHLQRRLEAGGVHACAVHGGLSPAERRAVLGRFAGTQRILLATDAAGEGLNLHERCRIVIHFELPWNPARMLQRAGRVDRIGQTRRVHEIALVAADTAETLVIAPFLRRAAEWSDARGRALLEWLTESRMADLIFDGRLPEVDSVPSIQAARTTLDLRADAMDEARRLEARRFLLTTGASARTGTGIPCATLTRSTLAAGVVAIYDVQMMHGREILERRIVALHCRLATRHWARKTSDLRRQIAAVLPAIAAKASPIIERLGADRADPIRHDASAALERARSRIRSRQQLHESAARQLVQIGLFDRRHMRTDAASAASGLLHRGAAGSQVDQHSMAITSSADLRALLLIPRR